MADPNLLTIATIKGKTDVLSVSTTPAVITTNPASSNTVFKINALMITNVDGTNPADIDVDLFRANTAYYVIKTVVVPADSVFLAIDTTNTLYLQEGDSLRCTASANGDLHAICSYEEMVV